MECIQYEETRLVFRTTEAGTLLTQDEAVRLAQKYIDTLASDCVVLAEPIVQGDYGWVFGWNSSSFIETGKFEDSLIGNMPLLIERKTGCIHVLGAQHPIEFYVKNLERFADPHKTLRKSPWVLIRRLVSLLGKAPR